MTDGTTVCKRCDGLYSSEDIGRDGICIDCQEGCCGTSKAPPGWFCRRPVHDEGPCAALPICGHDTFIWHNCLEVGCPCVGTDGLPCGGKLRPDGRNKMDTLTFLLCDVCACCYVAEDLKK